MGQTDGLRRIQKPCLTIIQIDLELRFETIGDKIKDRVDSGNG